MTDTTLKEAASKKITGAAPEGATNKGLVLRQKNEIGRALGNPELADVFVRAFQTEVSKTPELEECTQASWLGAVMTVAHLGLEPGPQKLISLLPFWNARKGVKEVQVIVQYRGYIELALRSGLLQSIEVHDIHENDHFRHSYGLNPVLEHSWDIRGERGKLIGFWGLAVLSSGGKQSLVMSCDEVDQYRARAKSSEKGPWVTDYAAMSRKTVVRRMEPYLPKSTRMAQAFASDGRTVLSIPGADPVIQEPEDDEDIVDAEVVPNPEPKPSTAPRSRRTRAPEPEAAPEPVPEPPSDWVDGGFDEIREEMGVTADLLKPQSGFRCSGTTEHLATCEFAGTIIDCGVAHAPVDDMGRPF